ncbi:MAG: hypothetical protein ABIH79_03075 [archaeon]
MVDCYCDESKRTYCLLKKLSSSEGGIPLDIPHDLEKESRIRQGVLENVCDGCKINCTLKQVVARYYDEKGIVQLRCMDDYGYFLGEIKKRLIESNESITEWITNGFAEKFAEVFSKFLSNNNELDHLKIYRECENALVRH